MIQKEFTVTLSQGIRAVATLTLVVPRDEQLVAELCGIGSEEIKRLAGQELKRIATAAGLNLVAGDFP